MLLGALYSSSISLWNSSASSVEVISVLMANKRIAFENRLIIIRIVSVLLLLCIIGGSSVIKSIASSFIGLEGIGRGFNLL